MLNRVLRVVALLVALAVLVIPAAAQESTIATPDEICAGATPAAEPESREYDQPEDVLESGVDYYAIFCTSEGAIYLNLFESVAPVTVNNFVFLAENDYYNNTIFHRVIEDFMAQAGDPTGTGSGGPGYQFPDEFVSYLTFDRGGLLAMANAGPGTNGSQFFITYEPTPWLDGAHTIFGEVLEGQEVVDAIQLRDPANADAPATDLQTVLIVTDPDIVDTTYEAPEAAVIDAEFFVEGFNGLDSPEVLPAEAGLNFIAPETLTAEDIAATAPDDLQADYADLLESNNHDFRVTVGLESATECRADFFQSVRYTIDSFSSADDVQAVIESDLIADLNVAEGYELFETNVTPEPFYLQQAEGCEGTVYTGRSYIVRGQYLITVDGTLNAGALPQEDVEDTVALILQQGATQIFDSFISDAFRASVR